MTFRIVKPRPGATRLFCFPYAGGGASVFFPWTRIAPPDLEICAAQLPGRESRIAAPLLKSFDELTAELLRSIEPLLDRPFAFYGHSMGTLVAFELARALRRAGRPQPLHLFVSGRNAPHLHDPDPPMHELPDDEFIAEMIRRYDGIPAEVLEAPELMQLLLPSLRADMQVIETHEYRDEPPLDMPITALAGTDDPCITSEGFQAWREYTRSRFTTHLFPGGHFFLHAAAAEVLRIIERALR